MDTTHESSDEPPRTGHRNDVAPDDLPWCLWPKQARRRPELLANHRDLALTDAPENAVGPAGAGP